MKLFVITAMILFSLQSFGAGVNSPMPNFSLPNLSGKGTFSLKNFKGKVVIIDFWASWCEPCKVELPALMKLYGTYKKKGLEVLGVNLDDSKDNAAAFLKEHKIVLPMAHDEGKKLATQVDVKAMPTSLILDRKGKIKFIHNGYNEGDIQKFEKEIKSLL